MKLNKRWIISLVCIGVLFTMMKVRAVKPTTGVLQGVTIIIDPGHGGKDDGARNGDVKEQEINLAISLKLKAELEKQGANIILTRDGAYDLASDGASNRKREDMKNRAAIINDEESDLFISVHLNAYPNVAIHGAHAFYRKNDEASKAFAEIVQKRFNELTKLEKSSKVGDYYILNETKRPGVLVECGFISNEDDRSKLMQEAYQQKLAEVLRDSVLEYLQVLSI